MAILIDDYTDNRGDTFEDPYLRIIPESMKRVVDPYNSSLASFKFDMQVWKSKVIRDTYGKDTIAVISYSISGANYTTYFAYTETQKVNKDETVRAYDYLKAVVFADKHPIDA